MRLALALALLIAAVTATASPRAPARLFVSGHSLTDNPMPPYLAQIAASLGDPVLWNRQYMVGSAIKYRVRGRDTETGWAGYSMGWNREGEGLNVIEEFRKPKTTDGRPYDTLIITEQHGVLDSLVIHDTVRYLRHYHDRFIDGNPAGRTFFYEPWLGIPDKSDPRRWIAYERAASPVWQCVVTRINRSLAAEGRPDRIASLPAGIALAELVERATQGPGLAGITTGNVRETVDRLFHDSVHLKPLGYYYVALISHAVVFDRSPVGAWAPEGVSAEAAASLQRVAWDVVSRYKAENRPWPLERCGDALSGPFKALYFDHMRDTYWPAQGSSFTTLKRLRYNLRWHWQLWRDHDGDAFHTRSENWFPPP
jgi:hypothetical protein